jgi:hypothetical protein
MTNDLIPVNNQGKPTDLELSIVCDTVDKARFRYGKAVTKMQNPGIWHRLAGWVSASFTLIGADAGELYSLAAEGDFIRIDIPGPGPTEGGGYDWVKIEKMETYIDPTGQREWTGMKVRPCSNPSSENAGTAHFFRGNATSTFIVEREGLKVTAFYHGRNEVLNTDTLKIGDNIRNALVAAGAMIGLSEAQWSMLIKGFLDQ